ncbi:MAG: chemotaxis protein CheW [Smithella sp.]
MACAESTDRTCIIATEIITNGNKIHIGIVVDSISEVLNIKSADIEDMPGFGSKLDINYILGVAKIGESVKIMLDIDKVMNNNDMGSLNTKIF